MVSINQNEENQYEVVDVDERIQYFNPEVLSIITTERTFNLHELSESEKNKIKFHYLDLKRVGKIHIFYEHLRAGGDDATIELIMKFLMKVEVEHRRFTLESPVYLVIMESVAGLFF